MNSEVIELAGNLIVDDRQILLVYREDEEHWEVPGGKVESDESPTEAAVREAREEIEQMREQINEAKEQAEAGAR